MMTKTLVPLFLTLSCCCLSIAWVLAGIWLIGLLLFLLLPVFLLLLKRKFPHTLNLALALLVGFAAFGLWIGLNFYLALAGLICVLSAWDLNSFSQRLVFASAEDGLYLIERQHFLQLGLILSIGLGISVVSRAIHITLSFEWAVVLAVLTFVGIGALVKWLRNKEI